MNKRASRTPAWLHTLRLAFPPVVTLVLVVLTEWIARGSLTVDTLTQYIFPTPKPIFWRGRCFSSSG